MNRKTISDALDLIDTKYISDAMSYSGRHDTSALERRSIMSSNDKRRSIKRIAAAAAAACLVMGMGITAFATNVWGIREMFGSINGKLDPAAADIIETHSESGTEGEITARITETLCDTNTFMATVNVTGGENIILAEADASLGDPVSTLGLGLEGNMTIGEYAAENGKTICPVSASIDCADESAGIIGAEISYAHNAGNDMTLLFIAHKTESFADKELVCKVYVDTLGETDNLTVVEIPFTATESSAKIVGIYSTLTPNACDGIILGNAVVTETALGYSLRMPVTVTDNSAFENTLMECEEADFLGGLVLEDDGTWYLDWTRGEGTIGDSFTIHCTDLESGETICEIEFVRN